MAKDQRHNQTRQQRGFQSALDEVPADDSPVEKALVRERIISDRAFQIVQAFGPQIGSGSGMQPIHFVREAYSFSEAFMVEQERRELAIQAEFAVSTAPAVESPSSQTAAQQSASQQPVAQPS